MDDDPVPDETWRPTPLQMSVPVTAVGVPYDLWLKRQPLYDPAELREWLAKYGPDAPVPVKVKKR